MVLHVNSLAPLKDLSCRYCGAAAGELCHDAENRHFKKYGLPACHALRRQKYDRIMGRLALVLLISRNGGTVRPKELPAEDDRL